MIIRSLQGRTAIDRLLPVSVFETLEKTYFPGIYEGDVQLLRTVYHPGTLLFGDVKGQPYARNLEQYLDLRGGRGADRYCFSGL